MKQKKVLIALVTAVVLVVVAVTSGCVDQVPPDTPTGELKTINGTLESVTLSSGAAGWAYYKTVSTITYKDGRVYYLVGTCKEAVVGKTLAITYKESSGNYHGTIEKCESGA